MCDIPKFPLKRHLSNDALTKALTLAVLRNKRKQALDRSFLPTNVESKEFNFFNFIFLDIASFIFIFILFHFIEHANTILNQFKVQNALPIGSGRFRNASADP